MFCEFMNSFLYFNWWLRIRVDDVTGPYQHTSVHPAQSRAVLTWTTGLVTLVIVFFATLAFAQYEYVSQFGTFGTDPGQFSYPAQVSVDSQGNILVADEGNQRVQICSYSGDCTVLGGANRPDFKAPAGVAEDMQGHIVVSEYLADRIDVCARNVAGNCAIQFGESGYEIGQFIQPRSVAIDSQNRILVTDSLNGRIQICTQAGACTSLGSSGTEHGPFGNPWGVDVDGHGNIIVADHEYNLVHVCTESGSCTSFGGLGQDPGKFHLPRDVAVDYAGRIIVIEESNHRLSVCGYDGVCTTVGGLGSGDGEFNFPISVDTDDQGNVIVSDRYNQRIQIFHDPDFDSIQFQVNAGLNDAWYNPATDGQGFFITVFPDIGYISLAWFTYDTELPPMNATSHLGDPGNRWLTAIGPIEGDHALMNIELTSGGIFDTPTQIARTSPPGSDGTLLLTFTDCGSGTVAYDIPSISRQGVVPIQRVANDNIALCEALSGN